MVAEARYCRQCNKVEGASLHQSGHVDNCPDDWHEHHAFIPPEQGDLFHDPEPEPIMDRFDDPEVELRREGGR